MRSKSWLVALALAVVSSRASAATVYLDDVEAGTGRWTTTGLWHRVGAGDACGGVAHSGGASLYYGSDTTCTYDTGAANSGSLTSPAFTIPADSASAFLDFWSNYETESTGAANDRRIVQLSIDGGPFFTLGAMWGDPMNAWVYAHVNLSFLIGHTVQVRFLFDTVTALDNAHRGWNLDDVSVTTTPLGLFNYAEAAAPYAWVDVAAPANRTAVSGDDMYVTRAIGFPFTFYGTTYTSVNISSNGYLTFVGDASAFSNQALPSTSAPRALVAPFWDDLYVPGGRYVYAATLGVAPDRRLVVTWDDVDFYAGAGPLGFQLVLSEADGSILFQYRDVEAGPGARGSSATVGVQNASGTAARQHSYDEPVLSNGTAIRYLPAPANVDSDGDGFPDWWEVRYGTNPNDPTSPDPAADVDGDGLSWRQELAAHTNPLDRDTDGDGVSDGEEVSIGTDPTVSDAPRTLITASGPGTEYGTAYFRFAPFGSTAGITRYRVFYGPRSGVIPDDYVGHFDLTDLTAREGYVDRRWGMQGAPMVYFRVVPVRVVDGQDFLGAPSNEHAAYFAGVYKGAQTAGAAVTTHAASSGCSAGNAGLLGLLAVGAVLPLRRRVARRRGAPRV